MLCDALDAAGLKTYRVGLGDASLYPALLEAVGVDAEQRERILERARQRRLRRRGARAAASSACSPRTLELLLRVPQIAGRPRGPRSDSDGPLQAAATGMQRGPRAARRRTSPSGSSSTSGWCAASATTRARCSRSTTPRTASRSAAAGATTSCSGRFGRPLPGGRVRAERRARCTSRSPARSGSAS